MVPQGALKLGWPFKVVPNWGEKALEDQSMELAIHRSRCDLRQGNGHRRLTAEGSLPRALQAGGGMH